MSATGQYRIEAAALLLRVSLGAVFLAHGLAKVLLYTIPGTVQFFEAVGFPGALAYPVIVVEIVGGAMLVLGLCSGRAALAMIPVALGATTVHWSNGWLFNNASGGWEFPAFLAIVALAHWALGTDGAFAAASLVQRDRPAGVLEPQSS